MRSAERSEAKIPRPKTQYCRKKDQLPPAFFMSLPLDAIIGSVAVLNVSGVRCLTKIGGVANEAIPCLSYICKYKGVEMINRAN